jgi:hypothetical protein
MVHGEARVFIERPVTDITDFIMDLHEYKKVDAKLGRIYELNRTGDTVVFTFRPKLLGLPGPKTTQEVVLTPNSRIDVIPEPSQMDKMMKFAAFFEFEEDKGGTWVRRRLEFDFAELCHEEGTCIGGRASATPSRHQALLKAAPAAGIVVIVRGRDEER